MDFKTSINRFFQSLNSLSDIAISNLFFGWLTPLGIPMLFKDFAVGQRKERLIISSLNFGKC